MNLVIFSLIIPGMVSRTLYVIPEFQRVVILKLGKFAGVSGPGRFWVIPYPPPSTRSRAALAVRRCAVPLMAHPAPLKKKGPGHAPVVGPAGPVQSADIEVPPGEG